jgi:phosphatidylglycerophosphate synthase
VPETFDWQQALIFWILLGTALSEAWATRPLSLNKHARRGTFVNSLATVAIVLFLLASTYQDYKPKEFPAWWIYACLALCAGKAAAWLWMRRERLWREWREDAPRLEKRLSRLVSFNRPANISVVICAVCFVAGRLSGSVRLERVALLFLLIAFGFGWVWLVHSIDARAVRVWSREQAAASPPAGERVANG